MQAAYLSGTDYELYMPVQSCAFLDEGRFWNGVNPVVARLRLLKQQKARERLLSHGSWTHYA